MDLDPRAVQIAAAALWLKAKLLAPEARPERLNLVAANLRLSSLPDTDAAVIELRREVERETGMPGALTDTLVHALRGADHLGSLLRVDAAVEAALTAHEQAAGTLGRPVAEQGGLFTGFNAERKRVRIGRDTARATLLDSLDGFLAKHTHGDDLGLRLRGEQLAAGVRFVRIVREGTYDVVVANPPYQGTAKMADTKYVKQAYPLGKADLYAAFLLRGLELVKPGGVSAMLTMRNWMFIKQYAGLRQHLLGTYGLRALHDLSSGAFEEISAAQVVVSVVSSVFARGVPISDALALKVFDDATVTQVGETLRKRAATLCHEGRRTFDPAALEVVPEWPLVYWWDAAFLERYSNAAKLKSAMQSRVGVRTSNNGRFVRRAWEPSFKSVLLTHFGQPLPSMFEVNFVPHVMGGAGRAWLEDVADVINWRSNGLEVCVTLERAYGAYPQAVGYYFAPLVALPKIGTNFRARSPRFRSIFDCASPSVFPSDLAPVLALLNASATRDFVQCLNPTVNL
ncbi:MAG: Eco57I restriction-modification methylase domain-containing protein, partial [Myxococcota bacterium]